MMCNIRFVIVVLLFVGAEEICGDSNIKGRLLTPEDGCGLVSNKVKNNRIVGGSKAAPGAWPWMTILGYGRGRTISFECGGSLITSRHVLTAGHCIENDLRVARFGEYDLSSTDDGSHEDVGVARAVAHKDHEPSLKLNDIGIVHLQRDVEFSDKIRPVCLPLDEPYRSRDFVDANAFVAGYGITHDCLDFGHRSQVLLQLQVPIVDNKKCKYLVYKWGATDADLQIKDHVICAGGDKGKGFWIGDSGGPLMLPIHQNGTFPFYQIGVVSFSYSCAKENVPSVYSKVQYHADWIKKQLGY